MQKVHDPTNAKQGGHETAEAVSPVADAVTVRNLRNDAQDNATEQGEKNRHLKMIQVKHRLVLLTRGDLVSIHHRKYVQESGGNEELRSVIARVPRPVGRPVTKPGADEIQQSGSHIAD